MLNNGIAISHKTTSPNLALKVTDSGELARDNDEDGEPDFSFHGH
jgi:hypothetical protein